MVLRKNIMNDLIFITVLILFFAAVGAYAGLCGKL